MASGFFYTIGYLSTKIENFGHKGKYKNPINNYVKSLVKGFDDAKKESDQSKELNRNKKTKKAFLSKTALKSIKKKAVRKKSSIKK